MVINLRGTSGSGKTTIVRQLMALGSVSVIGSDRKPDAYRLVLPEVHRPLFVIGSYRNVCGGCDSIKSQDEVCERVLSWAPHGHVLFEGLLVSGTFERYAKLDRKVARGGHGPYVWGVLDTPLAVCVNRINARRRARGQMKPVSPENTEAKYRSVVSSTRQARSGFEAANLDVRFIDHTRASDVVLDWLRTE